MAEALIRILVIISVLFQLTAAYSIGNSESGVTLQLNGLESKINEILEHETSEKSLLEDLVETKSTTAAPTSASQDFSISAASVSENHVVGKLVENTRRMEAMVGMLVDLKAVLTQAVATQEKQMALRTEVVELRDEISYLRDEVQKLKTQQVTSDNSGLSSKLVNKLHNDETTIKWLKDSMTEIRHEMTEISSSINVTGLYHLKQGMETQTNLIGKNVENLQKQFQAIQLDATRSDENILEIRRDIADLRTWQSNAGRQMVETENKNAAEINAIETNEISSEENPRFPKLTESSFREKLGLLIKTGDPTRHRQRKLRSELKTVERMLMGVMNDQSVLHQRLLRLERVPGLKPTTTRKLHSRNPEIDSRRQRRSSSSIEEYGASAAFRLGSLEKSMADYSNALETLDGRVSGLSSLRDSTTALFTVLEALETKYDGRLNEMQTSMGRIEASVSTLSLAADGVHEQQIVHSKQLQSMKKDLIDSKERTDTNHLRMASLQSQILEWGLKTCVDDSSETIQNIKLSKLETLLDSNDSN